MRAMKLVGKDWVFQQFVLWQSQLLRIRRDFHEHPELGFQTHRTAKRIADILLRFGVRHIDLKSVPGGVIAVIKRRRPVMFPDDKWEKMQPVIALRARIDASPATERNDIFYRSRNPGAAHTRGHDGEIAWLLGVARDFAHDTKLGNSTLVLIFEPGSETGRGADAVINSGIFEKYGIETIFGVCADPTLPMGTYGFTAPEPGAVPGASSGGNDPERTGYACDLINALFTDAARTDLPPLPVPDDFSRYQSIVPDIMLRFGVRGPKHQAALGSPEFDFNDSTLPIVCSLTGGYVMTIRQGWYENPAGYDLWYTVVWYECETYYPGIE